jgi:membrane associated rhomboid family serine protease
MLPIRDSVPRLGRPTVTWTLIALNLAVFLYELALPMPQLEALILEYGLTPARYSNLAWAQSAGLDPENLWPFWTTMFLHGGWMHIIGNMLSLWIFGGSLETRMGSIRFVLFYLVSGLAASLVHFGFNVESAVPAVGASGAIAGVMGGYFLRFPRASVTVLVPILFIPLTFDVPAVLYLGFWFVSQLFSGTLAILAPAAGGGIAWWAHIGGFLAGLVWVRLCMKQPISYSFFRRPAAAFRWQRPY